MHEGENMLDQMTEIRARLEWWETPGYDKVISVKGTQQLLDDTALLLAMYDGAGLASDRAQVIRAALQRWEDNPPQVGRPFTWDSLFSLVAAANWLLGAVEARNA
jgi:hypothetical protein